VKLTIRIDGREVEVAEGRDLDHLP